MAYHLIPSKGLKSLTEFQQYFPDNVVFQARRKSAQELIQLLEESGLRGRGGAGFPTSKKWASIAFHPCPTHYAVCNAAEGEPGTFKDRYLIRKNPYLILEGLLIAAHVVRAKRAYIVTKQNFSVELSRLRKAITEMESQGYCPQGYIQVVEGPDVYLLGEEKALLNVIEGEDPLPRPPEQPPYEWGLFGDITSPNPALVNNVETLAHAAQIFRFGPQYFREMGTDDTPGTILATLCGDVNSPGVYEVAAGTPISDIIQNYGQGHTGKTIKAVLSGVATGALTSKLLQTPAEFNALGQVGSGLASAGFIVVNDQQSMVRVAQSVARFLYVESCNQCTACKMGLGEASQGIDHLFLEGELAEHHLDNIILHAKSAPQMNRCYLPVEGAVLIPNLVQNFLKEFQDQFRSRQNDSPTWLLPKITDFDEFNHHFSYDERQAQKNPDWTFPVEAEERT